MVLEQKADGSALHTRLVRVRVGVEVRVRVRVGVGVRLRVGVGVRVRVSGPWVPRKRSTPVLSSCGLAPRRSFEIESSSVLT
jgi:hypothetical protein